MRKLQTIGRLAVPALMFFGAGCEMFNFEFEAERQEMINRKREVIYNTDGCDALYYPRQLPVTGENFQNLRLGFTRGSKIDSLFYCPVSSGFGYLTSRTAAGDQLLIDPPPEECSGDEFNATGELLKQGTDPLKLAEEYCKRENLEFFASLRVNDTHDSGHSRNQPYFLFPPFKAAHPELLFGSETERPPYCSWTAVDFAREEVRDRMAAIVAEICANYDIDGIEYDFMRHMQLFKSVAWGESASDQELELMTDFMKRLRSITEAAGRERGRPILVAVRVPDSLRYCKAVGIDLAAWARNKSFDLLIGSSYFQLNPWASTVAFARRHNLKFYASLDESRISGSLPLGARNSREAYSARALAALEGGCDGIYYFNMEYEPLRDRARGNRADLEFEDKVYYATERGTGGYTPDTYLRDGARYHNLPKLEPGAPRLIAPGGSYSFQMTIGDDPGAAGERSPEVVAMLRSNEPGHNFILKVNGVGYEAIQRRGDVLVYSIRPEDIRRGVNDLIISLPPSSRSGGGEAKTILSGTELLSGANQPPWRRIFMIEDFAEAEKIVDGAYRLADNTSRPGYATSLLYPLPALNGQRLKVDFELKVEKSTDPEAVAVRIANGKNVEVVSFEPEKIAFKFGGGSVAFNTADGFHHYGIVLDDNKITLTVDGKPLLVSAVRMRVSDEGGRISGNTENVSGMNENSLLFGSLSGFGTGSGLWKNIRLHQSWVLLNDFALGIRYRRPLAPALVDAVAAEIVPQAEIFSRNGKIETTGMVSNDYRPEYAEVQRDVIRLVHDSGEAGADYQAFAVTDPQLLENPPAILGAEWRVRVTGGETGAPSFQLVLAPSRGEAGGGVWEFSCRSTPDGVVTNLGVVGPAALKADEWNTFRVAIDTRSGDAALWINGKPVANGVISDGASRPEPFISIGDGSAGVSGRAELEYVRIGAIPSADEPTSTPMEEK